MPQEFSKEELEQIWKKVKPSSEELDKIEVKKQKIEIFEIKQTIEAKHVQKIFPEIDLLKERVRFLEDRLLMLENIVVENEQEEPREIELNVVPEHEAASLIDKYIEDHPGCLTGDIIFDLELDPDLVLRILNKLEEEKEIRGEQLD